MKVLIWIGCCVIPAIVNSIFLGIGVRLGGIPVALLYGGAIWLAKFLCDKLDYHRAMKKATEAGMTLSEYGKQGLPTAFLDKLEELRNVPYEQLKAQLKTCLKKDIITKEQYIILLREYSRTV